MKMRSILYTTMATSLLLTGCGSSSDSSDTPSGDDGRSGITALNGTWLGSRCEYKQYYPDTNVSDYERKIITIAEDTVEVATNIYSDGACTLLTSSSVDENVFADGGEFTESDTGLLMRKIDITSTTPQEKWIAYVNPLKNQLLLTEGDGDYPAQINLDDYFIKQNADLSYQDGEQHIGVLGHFGFNFKTGENDGGIYTSIWSPSNKYAEGESYGSGVWISVPVENDELGLYITGQTDLSAVTTTPANWLTNSDAIPAAVKGQVYIVRDNNGQLTKVKVLNTPETVGNWNLLVEYELM